MVERYRNQINQRDVPAAFGKNYVDAESMGADVWKAFGNVGESVAGLAAKIHERNEKIKAMQEKADKARAQQAKNDFNKNMREQTKQQKENQKKLDARDSTKNVNDYADNLAEELAGELDNDQQKNDFMSGLDEAKEPYLSQAATHEAEEMEVYEEEVYEEGLEQNLETIEEAPEDDTTWNAMMDQGMTAIQNRFADNPDKIEPAMKEFASQADYYRIESIAGGNVRKAYEEAQNSQFLSSKAKNALTKKLQAEVEKIDIQEMTDALIKKYPPEKSGEGFKYLRETLHGDMENKIATAYNYRVNELQAAQADVEREKKKLQKANFSQLRTNMATTGQLPAYSELTKMLDDESISQEDYNKALEWNEAKARRSKAIAHMEKTDPNWSGYKPIEQESKIMSFMGTTPEQRKATLDRIQRGLLDGSVNEEDIDMELNNGKITANEARYYKEFDENLNKEQKKFLTQQTKELKLDMTRTFPKNDYKLWATYRDNAEQYFSDAVMNLDPTSKTYRQDIVKARNDAYIQAVADSGKELEKKPWRGDPKKTQLGQKFDKVISDLEEVISGTKEYTPEPYKQNVDLESPPRSTETQIVRNRSDEDQKQPLKYSGAPLPEEVLDSSSKIIPNSDGNVTVTRTTDSGVRGEKNRLEISAGDIMLGSGKSRKSSGWNDTRNNGKRRHSAVDYAAPEGTPIRSANFGTTLTVTKSTTGKTTGNYIVLEGTLPNGQKITVRVLHMKGLSSLKPGDTVKAGDVIGRVGNTGNTSTGPHLHLDVSIDGVRVDPDAYLGMIQGLSARSSTEPASVDYDPVNEENTEENALEDAAFDDVTSEDIVSDDVLSEDVVSGDLPPSPDRIFSRFQRF
jgi:murein DD-endopeptidase MepM/ murein hydrolase activator NlpD